MENTSALPAARALPPGTACGRSDHGPRHWLGRHAALILGAAVLLAVAAALALQQEWVAAASLLPLLYVLPCAAMMFMCMRGLHQPPAVTGDTPPSSAPSVHRGT